jgi:hypothetical protein
LGTGKVFLKHHASHVSIKLEMQSLQSALLFVLFDACECARASMLGGSYRDGFGGESMGYEMISPVHERQDFPAYLDLFHLIVYDIVCFRVLA